MKNRQETPAGFFRRNARILLGAVLLLVFVHDIFGAHGFMAMRRTQKEIERVRVEIERLETENEQLAEQVHALKSDPKLIERIAREEMGLARPGEIIIKLPAKDDAAKQ
ncbi:MAG TPA: septum formation initiator family protein [Candidatus Dormibacteraeota bacterium]|nr:septum formation initiator family protein [Candidatus Dormibacteraeota bacterium]